VLCGNSTEKFYPAFEVFYSGFSELPFGSRQLFDGFVAACSERIEDVEDKAMLEIIRAQHGEVIQRIDQIALALSQLQKAERLDHRLLRDARLR
ncbi:hypothetical protein AB4144_62740, partial [Rhizobiaceae sp. 2RAB30]